MRKSFVDLCRDELANNPSSHVILGDISVGGFLGPDDQLIDRVHNLGITEQGIVGFAGGLSLVNTGGNIIAHTIAPFLVERALEQIKLCCGYNRARLILISANGPYDYERLGPTHHSASDVNLLSTIPHLDIRLPSTVEDFRESFAFACANPNSTYIRLTSRAAMVPADSVQVDPNYRRVMGGQPMNGNLDYDSAIVCTGETLKYVLERVKTPAAVYWTSDPRAPLPEEVLYHDNITIYEPYTSPLIAAPGHAHRRLFRVEHKKIISPDLGWEDFEQGK